MRSPDNDTPVTLDDFRASEWAETIASTQNKECVAYFEAFRAKVQEAKANGQEKTSLVFELLRDVCAFGFEPRQIADPFRPLMTSGTRRTATPADFGESNLETLRALAPEIDDAELRARVGDLVWIRKRDHRCAELAIDAYLLSASVLESGPVFQFSVQRLERALRLAVLLSNQTLFKKVAKEIEQVIARQQAQRGRVEFPELKRRAQSLYELRHPSVVLIEDTASGQSLLQELQRTLLPIKGLTPDADKTARANAITPTIENGQFWLLEGAPWLQDYLDEMIGFPGLKHDDFVDATVQALTYLREPEPAIIAYYRDMAAAEKAREQNREFPGISNYELAYHRLQAGNCHRCGKSLFMKSSVTDGLGHLSGMDCSRAQH